MNYDEVNEKLRKICEEYGDILGLVILFGSYSRRQATEESDIDLYIEPKDYSMTSSKLWNSKRYRSFQHELFNSFSQEFDILAYGGKRDLHNMKTTPLWRQIQKDGVTIYDERTKTV